MARSCSHRAPIRSKTSAITGGAQNVHWRELDGVQCKNDLITGSNPMQGWCSNGLACHLLLIQWEDYMKRFACMAVIPLFAGFLWGQNQSGQNETRTTTTETTTVNGT